MLSFLPYAEQKRIRRMYTKRVATVVATFTVVVSLLGLIILIPSYYLAQNKRQVLEQEFLAFSVDKNVDEDENAPRAVLARMRGAMRVLSAMPESMLLQNMVTVLKHRTQGIEITEIRYSRTNTDIGDFVVVGTAETRAQLVDFRDRVSEEKVFSKVDLPISYLAKDTNVAFQITITEANISNKK